MCENDVERVKRSLNSFNYHSYYSCQKGRKWCLWLLHNTVYRVMLLILLMSKGSKEAWTVLIVTHATHVERVESGVCGLCTQYRYIKHIFAHNFLNIQPIFDSQKVLKSWDLDLSNHTIQCYICWRGRKLFCLLIPSTCFNIQSIGWYGWKGLSPSFPKLFADRKSVEY